jgi:hypothetical protein
MTDDFWEGGCEAWEEGLQVAIRTETEQLAAAVTDEERAAAQRRVDELHAQQAGADENGDQWLF